MKSLLLLVGLLACGFQSAEAAWQHLTTTPAVAASNTDVTPLSVNYPASCCAAGDTLIYVARVQNATNTITWSNTPTLLYKEDSNVTIAMHATVATGAESGAVTVSASSSTRVIATILRYSGGPATLTGIVNTTATFTGGAANGLSWQTITPSVDNTLVIAAGTKTCVWTNASGGFGTERIDTTSTNSSLIVEDQIQTTATTINTGSWTFGADCSSTRRTIMVALVPAAACAGSPTITDVDTDESVTATQTNVVLTGTNFCSSGTVTLRQGGNTKTLSQDSYADTSIQVDMSGVGAGVASGLLYGSMDIRVANAAAGTDDQAITVTAPSGTKYATMTTLLPLSWDSYGSPSRVYGTPNDLQATSQLALRNAAGCTIATDITINDGASLTVDDACTSADFDFSRDGLYVGSVETLTFHGTPPVFGDTVIPSQVYAKDVAILPYDLDDYFTLGEAALSGYTLKQLSAPSAVDQANGAGVASTELTVDDETGIAVGDWLKVGSEYSRVKYVDPFNNVIGLWYAISWADNDTVSTMTVGDCTITGLSINGTTHEFEGTPTAVESNPLCFFRLTDTAGLTADSP